MEIYFKRALANVCRYGDTDIFPLPVENHMFFDMQDETIELLKELHNDFSTWLSRHPPANEGMLAPVSYTGFRWATQLDPLWNLYFLSIVLSIADAVESHRIPVDQNTVFSYRYKWDDNNKTIFDLQQSWRSFIERSLHVAKSHQYVVICDISEFYNRLGHHRLDNALAHLNLPSDARWRIMEFLKNFSNTNSFGLPVGGPAARILSELALNQIDHLLKLARIPFCRYSDDFHLFASSMEDGFSKLLFLTEKLQQTQGLQIQKSKTRILSVSEFISTSPFRADDHDTPDKEHEQSDIPEKARGLFRFSFRFDPYSPSRDADYHELKRELEKFDIVELLQAELSKSRIHVALARKIVLAVRFLDPSLRDQAILTLLQNASLLYPIFPGVLLVIRQTLPDLSDATKAAVAETLLKMIMDDSHVLRVELVLAYAVRVLAALGSPSVQETLVALHDRPNGSALIRRDVVLAMSRVGAWHWLSDRRISFRSMTAWERRAFIIASFSLKDEGKHWRQHTLDEFSPLEKLVRNWVSSKSGVNGWTVPL